MSTRTTRLRPGVLTAWRAPGRLQVGVGPRAVVLEGLSAADELVVDALARGSDPAALRRLAAAQGSPPARTDALLAALADAGALCTAPTPPDARATACVAVVGASPTGLATALGLVSAGTGTVLVEDDALVSPADSGPGAYPAGRIGARRAAAARLEIAELTPEVVTAPAERGRTRPDVVVLLASGAHDPRQADALVREGVVHLGVLLLGDDASVGPLVRPGTSACLRCLDLHRTDRDPEWPRLLPQLAGPPGGPHRPEPPALAALAAALAVQQVLTHLDGADPAALDATLEVGLGSGVVGVRPWAPHPRCGCTWAAGV